MQKRYYATIILTGFLFGSAVALAEDDCPYSHPPSVPPPAENTSTPPTVPPLPPSTDGPATVKEQMGLTLTPDAGGNKGGVGSLNMGAGGGGDSKKTFGPTQFMKAVRAYLNYVNDQISDKEKELKQKKLTKKWKEESGFNDAQQRLADKWEDCKKAGDREWNAGAKVRDIQDLYNRAGGEDKKLIGESLQRAKMEPAYMEAVGHRMVVEREAHDAAVELEASENRFNAMESSYKDSQRASIPSTPH